MANIYEKIRKKYGLSRLSMSKVLGFGVNQWRRYEAGEIEPKDSHALLIGVVQDPKSFRKMLLRHEEVLNRELGNKKFVRLLGMVDKMLGEFEKKSELSYQEWVEELYN